MATDTHELYIDDESVLAPAVAGDCLLLVARTYDYDAFALVEVLQEGQLDRVLVRAHVPRADLVRWARKIVASAEIDGPTEPPGDTER